MTTRIKLHAASTAVPALVGFEEITNGVDTFARALGGGTVSRPAVWLCDFKLGS